MVGIGRVCKLESWMSCLLMDVSWNCYLVINCTHAWFDAIITVDKEVLSVYQRDMWIKVNKSYPIKARVVSSKKKRFIAVDVYCIYLQSIANAISWKQWSSLLVQMISFCGYIRRFWYNLHNLVFLHKGSLFPFSARSGALQNHVQFEINIILSQNVSMMCGHVSKNLTQKVVELHNSFLCFSWEIIKFWWFQNLKISIKL